MPGLTLLMTLLLAAASVLSGTISAVAPDGAPFVIPGAGVSLLSLEEQVLFTTLSDDLGQFRFSDVSPGSYKLKVEMPGFQVFEKQILIHETPLVEAVQLQLAGLKEQMEVTAENAPLSTREASVAGRMEQKAIQAVPLRNEQFIDTLPLIPGVVRGADGLINIKGARSNQSELRVNSSTASDPVTGEYGFKLPIDVIESIETQSNPYSTEFGSFSSGITRITTRTGKDTFHFELHNPLPRFRRRDGSIVGIEAATPRVAFSGSIAPGKLYYVQSFEYKFVRTRVPSLPDLKNDTSLESFDSFTQLDYEINPVHHLSTTFASFPQKLGFVGLNTFNPEEVTPDFRQRGFFLAVAERAVFGQSLLESSYSLKTFDADVRPNGTDTMFLAPRSNFGGFFNRQSRESTLHQWLETYSFAPLEARGRHELRVGTDISYNTFNGRSINRPVVVLATDGTPLERIDFRGEGRLRRNQTQVAWFVQDSWNPISPLTLHLGLRYDRDSAVEENKIAPRIGFAYSHWENGRTVIRGGFGLFYGRVPLNVTVFDQMQARVVTTFSRGGGKAQTATLYQNIITQKGLRTPYSSSWNVEVGSKMAENLVLRVGFQQRNGRREFVLSPVEGGPAALLLDNQGSSRYRELNVTASYRLSSEQEFVFSYVRSQALGDLNDFNTHFGNLPRPIIRPNERSRLPFDTPHRLLVWGTMSLPHGFGVAPVLDLHTGFPYSLLDEHLRFVGPRNRAGRFPGFASLDLQVLKSLTIPAFGKKYRARLGVKIFNLTGHFNPRDIQSNLAAVDLGTFYNSVGRQIRGKFMIDF